MADDHRNREPPSQQESFSESQYPPPPGEEDPRTVPYHSRTQGGTGAPVHLPSMQDGRAVYPTPVVRSWDGHSNSYDGSPGSANGYPPPPSTNMPAPQTNYPPSGGHGGPYHHQVPGHHSSYLPPVQNHHQDPRQGYGDPYAAQRGIPYNSVVPVEYGYRHGPGSPVPYPAGPMMQQTAPRQRTSIACRYCRRRKIRCSGYQNSPGGKCTNCLKMNQECIFQPVSSSSSTAFVPVSALTHGIPPGTPLYGAYGQPLAAPTPGNSSPYGGAYPPGGPPYDQLTPSPVESYSSHAEERAHHGSRRKVEDDAHGMRRPPPSGFPPDGDHSRRSLSSSSSMGHPSHYPPLAPQPAPHPKHDDTTPPPRGSPTGLPTTGAPTTGGPTNMVMSLGNIMDATPGSANAIDQGMLGRLNRRPN